MGLAKGRGRGKGGVPKVTSRGPGGKPPPLMGRLAPPPGMGLRPRGPLFPPLVPRLRPPPPGMRSPRILPHPIPPVMGPSRPPMPPFHPLPPGRPLPPLPPPPPMVLRPPVPPPSLLGVRGQGIPPPLMHGPGFRPPGPPMMPKFVSVKRNVAMQKGLKKKPKAKKMDFSDDSEINKPWVTEVMKNEIQKKHKLYQKAKKSNQQTDWNEFKEQRNRVTTMIREAKLEYIGSHPEEVGDNFCETCERQFSSSLLYAEHVEEHQTCGLEGCTFSAHPKVVAKHIDMQHLTGLFNRIGKIESPEEISKWISDRKRHYPTQENIVKKQAETLEKRDRGERIMKDTRCFNRDVYTRSRRDLNCFNNCTHSRCRGKDNHKRGYGREGARVSQRKANLFEIKYEDEDSDSQEQGVCKGNLRLFPGMRFLEEIMHENVKLNRNQIEESAEYSDAEWENAGSSANKISAPEMPRALSGLCVYGSDGSDDDVPVEVPILRTETVSDTKCRGNSSLSIETGFEKKRMFDSFKDKNDLSILPSLKNILSDPENILSESQEKYNIMPLDFKQNCETSKEADADTSLLPSGVLENRITGCLFECESEQMCTGVNPSGKGDLDRSGNELEDSLNAASHPFASNNKHEVNKSKNLHDTCTMKKETALQCTLNKEKSKFATSGFELLPTKMQRKTLLEKLLEKEIRHERNVILQCVRYIVDNEFFCVDHTSFEESSNVRSKLECNSMRSGNVFLLQIIKFVVKSNFFKAKD